MGEKAISAEDSSVYLLSSFIHSQLEIGDRIKAACEREGFVYPQSVTCNENEHLVVMSDGKSYKITVEEV